MEIEYGSDNRKPLKDIKPGDCFICPWEVLAGDLGMMLIQDSYHIREFLNHINKQLSPVFFVDLTQNLICSRSGNTLVSPIKMKLVNI